MSKIATARISDELLAQIDRLAEANNRSRAWTIGRLLESATVREIELFEAVEKGRADIEAGRTIPHDELMARLRERWSQRKAA